MNEELSEYSNRINKDNKDILANLRLSFNSPLIHHWEPLLQKHWFFDTFGCFKHLYHYIYELSLTWFIAVP